MSRTDIEIRLAIADAAEKDKLEMASHIIGIEESRLIEIMEGAKILFSERCTLKVHLGNK